MQKALNDAIKFDPCYLYRIKNKIIYYDTLVQRNINLLSTGCQELSVEAHIKGKQYRSWWYKYNWEQHLSLLVYKQRLRPETQRSAEGFAQCPTLHLTQIYIQCLTYFHINFQLTKNLLFNYFQSHLGQIWPSSFYRYRPQQRR